MAEDLAKAVGVIARRHVPDAVLSSPDNLYVMPSDQYEGEGMGGYLAESGIILIRLSELFRVGKKEERKEWKELQELTRESVERMCAEEFDELSEAPFETQASCALMCVLTIDELGDKIWDMPKSLPPIRTDILKKINERIRDPHVAEFVREKIEGLFVPNSAYDAVEFIRSASSDERRAAYQLVYQARVSKSIAGKRAVEHLIDSAESHHVNAMRETIAHEMTHAISLNLLAEFPRKQADRSGYRVPRREPEAEDAFGSLNEACTEIITQMVMTNKDALDALMSDGEQVAYAVDRVLLAKILIGIAKMKSESLETVWERFERGYFTGELMQLRDIEKAFGKEAWDYYKNLAPETLRELSGDTIEKLNKHFRLRLPA